MKKAARRAEVRGRKEVPKLLWVMAVLFGLVFALIPILGTWPGTGGAQGGGGGRAGDPGQRGARTEGTGSARRRAPEAGSRQGSTATPAPRSSLSLVRGRLVDQRLRPLAGIGLRAVAMDGGPLAAVEAQRSAQDGRFGFDGRGVEVPFQLVVEGKWISPQPTTVRAIPPGGFDLGDLGVRVDSALILGFKDSLEWGLLRTIGGYVLGITVHEPGPAGGPATRQELLHSKTWTLGELDQVEVMRFQGARRFEVRAVLYDGWIVFGELRRQVATLGREVVEVGNGDQVEWLIDPAFLPVIHGHVVDQGGQPIRGASIKAAAPGLRPEVVARSGDQGQFLMFRKLPSYGFLFAVYEEFQSAALAWKEGMGVVELRFDMHESTMVKVVDRSGEPVLRYTLSTAVQVPIGSTALQATGEHSGGLLALGHRRSMDGTRCFLFTEGGVAVVDFEGEPEPGTRTYVVDAPEPARLGAVRLADNPFFGKGHRLILRHAGADHVGIPSYSFRLAGGGDRFEHILPGRYRAELSAGGRPEDFWHEAEIEIVPGADCDIDLPAAPGLRGPPRSVVPPTGR